jgi:hypothetical protein
MASIDVLRDEYPGDEAWRRFVDVFQPAWTGRVDKEPYREKLGNEDFAVVLTATMGGHALEWFNKPLGALGKRTPAEILQSEPSGDRILRTLLMRMPR